MVIYILLKILLKLQTKIILIKCKKIFKGDFLSEFNRSMIISKLIKKFILSKKFLFLLQKILL